MATEKALRRIWSLGMHGMINRALQGFLETNYGDAVWAEVRELSRLPPDGFEAMEYYDDALTRYCFEAAVMVR